MSRQFNRRRFLAVAGQSTASLLILANSRSAFAYAENEKLSIGVIGAGGRGAANLTSVEHENIVALCDVDQRRAAGSFAKYAKTEKHRDYRQMLESMDRQIDAVVVSTPNHIHAPASVTAMRMGKHCYCEKPLSHSVFEARVAAEVASNKQLATQMGTQIHASDNYRRIVELIRTGAIGKVLECHCWLRGGGSAMDRPQATPPVPATLDWNLWLGPAPERPYHSCYVPHDWHYWWDFGGGAFGNMGCHYLDLAFWALDLHHPATIIANGSPPHAESTPAIQHVKYQFPTSDQATPVTLTWTHGSKPPTIFEENQFPTWTWGVFVGTQGMLLASYSKHQLLPESSFSGFQPPEPSIEPSVGHHQEWINACKTGSPTTCNFQYSGAVTETMLLGNIAYRTGRELTWNATNMRFVNDADADRYLQRDYRTGWTL